MRYLILLIALLFLSNYSFAQSPTYPNVHAHGDSTTLDSNQGGQFIALTLQMPLYANSDPTQFLTVDDFGNVYLATASGGSGMAIGNAVTGADDNVMLFIDNKGNLAQDPLFTYGGGNLALIEDNSDIVNQPTDGSAYSVMYNRGTNTTFIGQGTIDGSWLLTVDTKTGGPNFSNVVSINGELIGYNIAGNSVVTLNPTQLSSGGNNTMEVATNNGFQYAILGVPDGGGKGPHTNNPYLTMVGADSSFTLTTNKDGAYINAPLTIGAYTLPVVDGASDYVLTTNGAGIVGWAPSGSSSPQTFDQVLKTGNSTGKEAIFTNGSSTLILGPTFIESYYGSGVGTLQGGQLSLGIPGGVQGSIEAPSSGSEWFYQLPNESGTFAMLSDIPGSAGAGTVVATFDLTSQTSVPTIVASYAVPTTAALLVTIYVNINSLVAPSANLFIDITYTDPASHVITKTFYPDAGGSGGYMNAASDFTFPTKYIRVKGGTTVSIISDLNMSGGSISYDIGGFFVQYSPN